MRERTSARLQRSISAVCLAVSLASCTGWHEMAMGPPAPISDQAPSLGVTLTDGRQIELREARIAGDSLVGQSSAWSTPVRTAFAVRDIRKFDDRKTNVGSTLGLIGGIVGAVAMMGTIGMNSAFNSFGN